MLIWSDTSYEEYRGILMMLKDSPHFQWTSNSYKWIVLLYIIIYNTLSFLFIEIPIVMVIIYMIFSPIQWLEESGLLNHIEICAKQILFYFELLFFTLFNSLILLFPYIEVYFAQNFLFYKSGFLL